MSEQDSNTIKWIDMSAYGIYFGVVDMPSGERRAVMVDESDAHAVLGEAVQFRRSAQIDGVWFKVGERFTIPRKIIVENYPLARPVSLTEAERLNIIKRKLFEANTRMKTKTSSGPIPGWKPNAKVKAEPEPATAPAEMPLAVAIKQSIYCGFNASGQEVYEMADATRYIKADNKVIAREEGAGGAEFLRASGVSDREGLLAVAHGLVREMRTKKLRSKDFARYVNAALGPGSDENEHHVVAFQVALDAAITDSLKRELDGLSNDDVFQLTRMFHDMRPNFFRPDGTYPTPVPIAAAMQEILLGRLDPNTSRVVSFDSGIDGQHTWMLRDVEPAMATIGSIPEHSCAIGGVYSHAIAEEEIDGLLVSRADHAAILKSLQKRTDEGVSVFVLAADGEAGEVEPVARRVLSAIGSQYEIAGLVDLEPSMIGEGVTSASRIIVVGNRKAETDFSFAPPTKVSVLYDFDELQTFARSIVGQDFAEVQNFGETRQANRLQSPYIPHSQISEPVSMSPKNLLAPTRRALSRLVSDEGLSVDDYVCHKLGVGMDILESGILNAEQVDAIALGIRAIDEGRGFVVADQTGLGKGRILAALAAYSVKCGKRTMFLTEKSELFADLYRDVRDVGMESVLKDPVLLNTSGGVSTMDGSDVLYPPSSREAIMDLVKEGSWPENAPFVLGTYSIFNREAANESDLDNYVEAERIIGEVRAGKEFDDIDGIYRILGLGHESSSYRNKLRAPDGSSLRGADLMDKLREISTYDLDNIPIDQRQYSRDDVSHARREITLRKLRPAPLAAEIEKLHRKPLNAWRALWVRRCEALEDVVLLMDESHNAAGNSNTGENLRLLGSRVNTCIYSSATFAKAESDLPLYSRIFPAHVNPNEIQEIVSKGGEPLREILAGMLAEDGAMIRREHDTGAVRFVPVHDSARADLNMARKDAVAHVLKQMAALAGAIQRMVKAQNVQAKNNASTFTYSYSGPFSRFYAISRAFSCAIGAEHNAELAIQAIRENEKPVLTIESTMESVLKDLLRYTGAEESADGRVVLGRNLDFRDLMRRYADNMFNVYQVQRNGRKIVSKKLVAMAPPGMEQDVLAIRKAIEQLPAGIPISPIDAIREKIEAAGYSFGEVSGRTMRLCTAEDGTQYLEKIDDLGKGASVRTVDAFNSGKLDAMILSLSGSTGISAQSSRHFLDQRQRTLIEAQQASNIRERTQFFGRVYRTNQVCPPKYLLPSSGLAHDRRLQMIQNTSSRKMSAQVSGNSDNNMIDESVPEIMNQIGNEVCFHWLENRPDIAALMNINLGDDKEEGDGDDADIADDDRASTTNMKENAFCGTEFVDKLTGRLFMLPSDEEALAWSEINSEYKALIEQYETQGYNPLKSSQLDIRAKRGKSLLFESISAGSGGRPSAFDAPVHATEVEYRVHLKALDIDAILEEVKVNQKAFTDRYGLKGITVLEDKIQDAAIGKMKCIAEAKDSTIEWEMASSTNNKVKVVSQRAQQMRSTLRKLGLPGQVVEIQIGDDDQIAMVLDIIPPARDMMAAAQWKVRLLQDDHSIRDYSLSTLLAARLYPYTQKTADRKRKELLTEVASDQFITESQVFLEGNLFLAAQTCNRLKRGEAVSYTDDRGVWRQAFAMPKSMGLGDIMYSEVVIRDPQTGFELLNDENTVFSNAFDAKRQIFRIERNSAGGIDIHTKKPEAAELVRARTAILRDEVLKNLAIDGKSKGSKGIRSFSYTPDNSVAALGRVIEVAAMAGHPVCGHPRLREVIAARNARLAEAIENNTSKSLATELGL